MTKTLPEFMRFTAADPAALSRSIDEARAKLSEAEARGDAPAMLDHAADLGGMLTTARSEAAAVEVLRRHESLADSHPAMEQIAWFWNALATALQYLDERERAEVYFAKALAAAQGGGWKRIEALALHHWGRSLVEQGRFDEAESRIQRALAIREELNAPGQESSRRALEELGKRRAAGDS